MKKIILLLGLVLFSSIALAEDGAICEKPNMCVLQGKCFDAGWSDIYNRFSCGGVPGDVDCDGDSDYCRGSDNTWVDCGTGCDDCCDIGEICQDNNCVPHVETITGCGQVINTSGTYYLDSDISGCGSRGIIIKSDNVVLDCNNHRISGTSLSEARGISIENSNNVRVEDCITSNFYDGIYAVGSTVTMIRNTVDGTGSGGNSGIYLSSTSSLISGNTIKDADNYGIYITGSSGTGNLITSIQTLQEK